jgi:hypothetical protein
MGGMVKACNISFTHSEGEEIGVHRDDNKTDLKVTWFEDVNGFI